MKEAVSYRVWCTENPTLHYNLPKDSYAPDRTSFGRQPLKGSVFNGSWSKSVRLSKLDIHLLGYQSLILNHYFLVLHQLHIRVDGVSAELLK